MTDQIDKIYEHETEKEHAIRDALDLQTVSSAHNITPLLARLSSDKRARKQASKSKHKSGK